MNFDKSFKEFKDKYGSKPRVVSIIENEFGSEDITVLFYDKKDKFPPLYISAWQDFPVSYCGVFALKDMFESLFDAYVLNDPKSWDSEVSFSYHYKSICMKIADYELRK